MNKQKGFTLIELMISVAIAGILLSIVYGALFGEPKLKRAQIQHDQPRFECVEGFTFDTKTNRQLIGENGGGVVCFEN